MDILDPLIAMYKNKAKAKQQKNAVYKFQDGEGNECKIKYPNINLNDMTITFEFVSRLGWIRQVQVLLTEADGRVCPHWNKPFTLSQLGNFSSMYLAQGKQAPINELLTCIEDLLWP